MDLDARPLPPPPPRFAARALLAARRLLHRLADRIVPGEIAVFERTVGFGATVLLREVARLKVADALEGGPKDATTLAAELGVRPEPLHRVLRAMASQGVFAMDARGRFSNNHVSRGLLDRPGSMRTMAAYLGDRHNLMAWDRIDEVLREEGDGFRRAYGTDLWSWYEANPEAHARFAAMMADQTFGDASSVATGYPFPAGAEICDVGGGIGTQLSEILVRHPSARGVLFDSARTLARASELLGRRGVLDRVRLVEGSFFEEVPTGADVYLLKNVLHDWGDEPALRILRRVREAMKPGARLLVVEALIEHDDASHPRLLADLHMMMLCEGGRERSRQDLRDLLGRAGLRVTRILETPVFLGLVEAEPA